MDPLSHTLVGALMADSLGRRRTTVATFTLLIGANLPDVDVVAHFGGSDNALLIRRGWTHGVLAMAVLPALLAGAMVLYDRWRQRRGRAGSTTSPGLVLLLSYAGVLSHPLLDWLNTYGVRFLMPFDGSWFYGDTLFIIDPWLWLLFGGTCFLLHSQTRRRVLRWSVLGLLTSVVVVAGSAGYPLARLLWIAGLAVIIALRIRAVPPTPAGAGRIARRTLAVAGLYTALMMVGTVAARHQVYAALPEHDLGTVEDVFVGPVAIDPFARAVVISTPTAYHLGTFDWLRSPRWQLREKTLAPPPESPAVTAALQSSCVQGMVNWIRYPWVEVDTEEDGFTVHLMDARYATSRTGGFGGSSVRLDQDLEDRCTR